MGKWFVENLKPAGVYFKGHFPCVLEQIDADTRKVICEIHFNDAEGQELAERISRLPELEKENADLRQQRNNLLTALKSLLAEYEAMVNEADFVEEVMSLVDNAIASVEKSSETNS